MPDNTDRIPYKAYLIADEDWHEMINAIVANVQAVPPSKVFPVVAQTRQWYVRLMFQCTQCGRLLVEKRGEMFNYYSFPPDDRADSKDALRTVKQSHWKGTLCGYWGEGSLSKSGNSIWWECGDGEHGMEEFSEWDTLAARYRELFTALRRRDVLWGAFLKKDGEMVHYWPPQPGLPSKL